MAAPRGSLKTVFRPLVHVASLIACIRRKFQALDSGFAAIETAYGVGYRWAGSVA